MKNLLIHCHAGIGGLGRWLTFEEQLATNSVSAIGANDDVGLEYFSRFESDGLSRDIDRGDFGVRPILGSSFIADLVEEFSDIRELDRQGYQNT